MSSRGMSPRLALVIIAAIFVVPLVAAWLMYTGVIDYDPVETRNLGALVQPPVPVSLDGLEFAHGGEQEPGELGAHWIVLLALPEPCTRSCLETVTGLRQVHRAAGRNQSRIRLLAVGKLPGDTAKELHGIYPHLYLASDLEGGLTSTLQDVAAAHGGQVEDSAYLIDPLGNIMLFYAAGFDPNDLKKDLKRLLTWSKLDEN